MGLTIITGPANAAKAQQILERYRLALAREPILVVPRAADVDHYSRELAGAGAVLGIRVEAFGGLLREISSRAGIAAAAIGPTARERIVASVVARAGLDVLAAASQSPGFAGSLAGFFAELEARRAAPARFTVALRAWAPAGSRRATYAEELAGLYSSYRAALERLGRLDQELLAAAALDALRLAPERWGRTPVFIYGFDDLDPLQLDAVETLANHVGAPVTISLPGEGGRLALSERAATLETLRPAAEEVVELEAAEDFYEAPELHQLERALFEDATPVPCGDAVELLEGGDERAEAELIGRDIELLLRAGCAAGDVAVVTRGTSAVAAALAQVLDSRAIPYTAARRERFADTALGGALLALLRAALLGGGAADLVRWLRAVARPDFADRVEAQLLREGTSGLAEARALLEAQGFAPDVLDRLAEAARRPPPALIERVEREADALFEAPWRRDAALLDPWDAAVLRTCRRTLRELRDLARADARLEGGPAAIAAALETTIVELAPSTDAQAVLICDALALRARRVRALYITGLQEGEFPGADSEQPFLSSGERDELARASGLLLTGAPAAERYLFYALCSRPTRWLRLSWHGAGDDGEPSVRSLFVDEVIDVFGTALFERREQRAAGAIAWTTDAPPALARLQDALSGPRLRDGVIAPLADASLMSRLRERASFSPSALESWTACPVAWFVERGLRAEKLAPDEIWTARGSAAHEALRRVFAGLQDRTGSAAITHASLPVALEELDAALDAPAPALSPSETVERAERWRLRSDLRRYLEHAARSASTHEPQRFETSFGLEHSEQPAVLLADGRLELAGQIDRLDVDPQTGTALVYDYKTSARVSPLARWVEDGRLQPALYMLAAERLFGVEAAGGLYQPLRNSDLRARGAIRDDVDTAAALVSNDRLTAEGLRSLIAERLETAVVAAAQMAEGKFEPRPATCGSSGCRYPEICRSEAR
ncbi:MAG TPA: PD-(D/E)XK nuclease family protein [Solirubrobacteraceae bacterium]|nr:PD-(D/E)XK nuclease family protein [Solirubrobacteraceae bacterium]